MYLSCVPKTGSQGTDGQNNVFDRLYFAVKAPDCLYLDTPTAANWSFNRFGQIIFVNYATSGSGVVLAYADNNVFDSILGYFPYGTTGYGLIFGSASTTNTVDVCSTTVRYLSSSTGSVRLYDDANYALTGPSVAPGTGGVFFQSASGITVGGGHIQAISADPVAGNWRQNVIAAGVRLSATESHRIYNVSNKHLVLDDGAHEVWFMIGAGAPAGANATAAPNGSEWTNTTGGAGSTKYAKVAGTWTALA